MIKQILTVMEDSQVFGEIHSAVSSESAPDLRDIDVGSEVKGDVPSGNNGRVLNQRHSWRL